MNSPTRQEQLSQKAKKLLPVSGTEICFKDVGRCNGLTLMVHSFETAPVKISYGSSDASASSNTTGQLLRKGQSGSRELRHPH